MHIRDLNGKTVCILGYGREGQAMLEVLEKYAPECEITIADQNPSISIANAQHWKQLGGGWLENLDKFDVLIKSPGIPPQSEFRDIREKITNSTQIFLDSIDPKCTVIGVTGTKGKSTTATLIAEILKAAGKSVYLIGNIGDPAIRYIDRGRPNTIFVQEMSSFQLMELTRSPHIAVIVSFFPEHLDYHGTLENYRNAKKHITKFQDENECVFYNREFPGCAEIARESRGHQFPYSKDDCPITADEIHLLGDHNLGNVVAAWKVARHLGIENDVIERAVMQFRGLPHRLESLGVRDGMEWVDDAISTTPESTIAALDALGDRVACIILGGLDRGLNFAELGKRIARSHVRLVILFPESGKRIRSAIEAAGAAVEFADAKDMETAVKLAKGIPLPEPAPESQPPIVLLSTASPSYNMFKNFEAKGEEFRRCIGL